MISSSSNVSRSGHRVTSSDPCQSRPSRIPTIIRSPIHSSSKSCPQSPYDQKSNKDKSHIQKSNGGSSSIFGSHEAAVKKKCGFEAYMMTGDLILNLSRNQQSADILTTQFRKVRNTQFSHKHTLTSHLRTAQIHTDTIQIETISIHFTKCPKKYAFH